MNGSDEIAYDPIRSNPLNNVSVSPWSNIQYTQPENSDDEAQPPPEGGQIPAQGVEEEWPGDGLASTSKKKKKKGKKGKQKSGPVPVELPSEPPTEPQSIETENLDVDDEVASPKGSKSKKKDKKEKKKQKNSPIETPVESSVEPPVDPPVDSPKGDPPETPADPPAPEESGNLPDDEDESPDNDKGSSKKKSRKEKQKAKAKEGKKDKNQSKGEPSGLSSPPPFMETESSKPTDELPSESAPVESPPTAEISSQPTEEQPSQQLGEKSAEIGQFTELNPEAPRETENSPDNQELNSTSQESDVMPENSSKADITHSTESSTELQQGDGKENSTVDIPEESPTAETKSSEETVDEAPAAPIPTEEIPADVQTTEQVAEPAEQHAEKSAETPIEQSKESSPDVRQDTETSPPIPEISSTSQESEAPQVEEPIPTEPEKGSESSPTGDVPGVKSNDAGETPQNSVSELEKSSESPPTDDVPDLKANDSEDAPPQDSVAEPPSVDETTSSADKDISNDDQKLLSDGVERGTDAPDEIQESTPTPGPSDNQIVVSSDGDGDKSKELDESKTDVGVEETGNADVPPPSLDDAKPELTEDLGDDHSSLKRSGSEKQELDQPSDITQESSDVTATETTVEDAAAEPLADTGSKELNDSGSPGLGDSGSQDQPSSSDLPETTKNPDAPSDTNLVQESLPEETTDEILHVSDESKEESPAVATETAELSEESESTPAPHESGSQVQGDFQELPQNASASESLEGTTNPQENFSADNAPLSSDCHPDNSGSDSQPPVDTETALDDKNSSSKDISEEQQADKAPTETQEDVAAVTDVSQNPEISLETKESLSEQSPEQSFEQIPEPSIEQSPGTIQSSETPVANDGNSPVSDNRRQVDDAKDAKDAKDTSSQDQGVEISGESPSPEKVVEEPSSPLPASSPAQLPTSKAGKGKKKKGKKGKGKNLELADDESSPSSSNLSLAENALAEKNVDQPSVEKPVEASEESPNQEKEIQEESSPAPVEASPSPVESYATSPSSSSVQLPTSKAGKGKKGKKGKKSKGKVLDPADDEPGSESTKEPDTPLRVPTPEPTLASESVVDKPSEDTPVVDSKEESCPPDTEQAVEQESPAPNTTEETPAETLLSEKTSEDMPAAQSDETPDNADESDDKPEDILQPEAKFDSSPPADGDHTSTPEPGTGSEPPAEQESADVEIVQPSDGSPHGPSVIIQDESAPVESVPDTPEESGDSQSLENVEKFVELGTADSPDGLTSQDQDLPTGSVHVTAPEPSVVEETSRKNDKVDETTKEATDIDTVPEPVVSEMQDIDSTSKESAPEIVPAFITKDAAPDETQHLDTTSKESPPENVPEQDAAPNPVPGEAQDLDSTPKESSPENVPEVATDNTAAHEPIISEAQDVDSNSKESPPEKVPEVSTEDAAPEPVIIETQDLDSTRKESALENVPEVTTEDVAPEPVVGETQNLDDNSEESPPNNAPEVATEDAVQEAVPEPVSSETQDPDNTPKESPPDIAPEVATEDAVQEAVPEPVSSETQDLDSTPRESPPDVAPEVATEDAVQEAVPEPVSSEAQDLNIPNKSSPENVSKVVTENSAPEPQAEKEEANESVPNESRDLDSSPTELTPENVPEVVTEDTSVVETISTEIIDKDHSADASVEIKDSDNVPHEVLESSLSKDEGESLVKAEDLSTETAPVIDSHDKPSESQEDHSSVVEASPDSNEPSNVKSSDLNDTKGEISEIPVQDDTVQSDSMAKDITEETKGCPGVDLLATDEPMQTQDTTEKIDTSTSKQIQGPEIIERSIPDPVQEPEIVDMPKDETIEKSEPEPEPIQEPEIVESPKEDILEKSTPEPVRDSEILEGSQEEIVEKVVTEPVQEPEIVDTPKEDPVAENVDKSTADKSREDEEKLDTVGPIPSEEKRQVEKTVRMKGEVQTPEDTPGVLAHSSGESIPGFMLEGSLPRGGNDVAIIESGKVNSSDEDLADTSSIPVTLASAAAVEQSTGDSLPQKFLQETTPETTEDLSTALGTSDGIIHDQLGDTNRLPGPADEQRLKDIPPQEQLPEKSSAVVEDQSQSQNDTQVLITDGNESQNGTAQDTLDSQRIPETQGASMVVPPQLELALGFAKPASQSKPTELSSDDTGAFKLQEISPADKFQPLEIIQDDGLSGQAVSGAPMPETLLVEGDGRLARESGSHEQTATELQIESISSERDAAKERLAFCSGDTVQDSVPDVKLSETCEPLPSPVDADELVLHGEMVLDKPISEKDEISLVIEEPILESAPKSSPLVENNIVPQDEGLSSAPIPSVSHLGSDSVPQAGSVSGLVDEPILDIKSIVPEPAPKKFSIDQTTIRQGPLEEELPVPVPESIVDEVSSPEPAANEPALDDFSGSSRTQNEPTPEELLAEKPSAPELTSGGQLASQPVNRSDLENVTGSSTIREEEPIPEDHRALQDPILDDLPESSATREKSFSEDFPVGLSPILQDLKTDEPCHPTEESMPLEDFPMKSGKGKGKASKSVSSIEESAFSSLEDSTPATPAEESLEVPVEEPIHIPSVEAVGKKGRRGKKGKRKTDLFLDESAPISTDERVPSPIEESSLSPSEVTKTRDVLDLGNDSIYARDETVVESQLRDTDTVEGLSIPPNTKNVPASMEPPAEEPFGKKGKGKKGFLVADDVSPGPTDETEPITSNLPEPNQEIGQQELGSATPAPVPESLCDELDLSQDVREAPPQEQENNVDVTVINEPAPWDDGIKSVTEQQPCEGSLDGPSAVDETTPMSPSAFMPDADDMLPEIPPKSPDRLSLIAERISEEPIDNENEVQNAAEEAVQELVTTRDLRSARSTQTLLTDASHLNDAPEVVSADLPLSESFVATMAGNRARTPRPIMVDSETQTEGRFKRLSSKCSGTDIRDFAVFGGSARPVTPGIVLPDLSDESARALSRAKSVKKQRRMALRRAEDTVAAAVVLYAAARELSPPPSPRRGGSPPVEKNIAEAIDSAMKKAEDGAKTSSSSLSSVVEGDQDHNAGTDKDVSVPVADVTTDDEEGAKSSGSHERRHRHRHHRSEHHHHHHSSRSRDDRDDKDDSVRRHHHSSQSRDDRDDRNGRDDKDDSARRHHRHRHHRRSRAESELTARSGGSEPSSPRTPKRQDSGFSESVPNTPSSSSKKQRTPEEQAAHDKRKQEHREARAREARERERESKGKEPESPSHHRSLRRHSHRPERPSSLKDETTPTPTPNKKFFDMKSQSVLAPNLSRANTDSAAPLSRLNKERHEDQESSSSRPPVTRPPDSLKRSTTTRERSTTRRSLDIVRSAFTSFRDRARSTSPSRENNEPKEAHYPETENEGDTATSSKHRSGDKERRSRREEHSRREDIRRVDSRRGDQSRRDERLKARDAEAKKKTGGGFRAAIKKIFA